MAAKAYSSSKLDDDLASQTATWMIASVQVSYRSVSVSVICRRTPGRDPIFSFHGESQKIITNTTMFKAVMDIDLATVALNKRKLNRKKKYTFSLHSFPIHKTAALDEIRSLKRLRNVPKLQCKYLYCTFVKAKMLVKIVHF